MVEENLARRRGKRHTAVGRPIGLSDGVPIPPFMVAVDEINFLEARVALPIPPGQFVGDFTLDKQEDDDLCWAAVTASAARYRHDGNWTQQRLVQDAHQVEAEQCPCTDHPGDGGRNLWCVDCAFTMIRLPYKHYTEAPWFSSLGQAMALKKPVCILRTGVPQNHYVVAVGTYVNALGQQMVRISDPDPSQPEQQDVEYRSLVTGPEAVLEWYQF